MNSMSQPIQGQIAEAHLIINRFNLESSFAVQLAIADSTGKYIAQAFHSISPARANPAAGGESKPEENVQVSERAKQHARLMQYQPSGLGANRFRVRSGGNRRTSEVMIVSGGPSGSPPHQRPEVTAEWRNILSNPEQHDPLSFVVSELWLGAANQLDKNLVACPPDSAVLALGPLANEGVRPSRLVSASGSAGMSVADADGWLIVKSSRPYTDRIKRTDRQAAGRMLRSIGTNSRLTMDDFGAFALTITPGFTKDRFVGATVGLLDESSFTVYQRGTTNELFSRQLYATLSPTHRQSLMNNGHINLGQLTPQQRSIVDRMVFDAPNGPVRMLPSSPNETRNQTVIAGSGQGPIMMTSDASMHTERTEYLGGGLPYMGTLKLNVQKEDVVFATTATGGDGQYMSAEEVAMHFQFADSAMMGANQSPKMELFRPAWRSSFAFDFQFAQDISMESTFDDMGFSGTVAPKAYDQLPEAFRQEVEKLKERFKVNFGSPPTPPAR
jgi:hypothetical protein